jgi:hypothetical protein
MVFSHLRSAPEFAAGVASLPDGGQGFAAVQAAWRFLNNGRVTLPALVQPLREVGRSRAGATTSPFAILVHDWSKLTYRTGRCESGKRDLVQLTHATDIGYELTASVLVSADDGSPLAPMELHCLTDAGLLSTRAGARAVGHLEQVLPTMKASLTWGLTKPLLHVIDREADSVDHYRRWHKAGHKFLVRADDRRVRWGGKRRLLSDIKRQLRCGHKLQQVGVTGGASYHGKPATLWVAETEVILDRPAKKKINGKSVERPGAPLMLRYVVVQLREEGKLLAEWMLLSNAPGDWVTTEQLARCYYWRWRIESFFKLLKSHGQQLENWQQETGLAIARRMLVAAMACVLVWQLQHDDSSEAIKFKNVLIRLSGRQMKRTKRHTAPALLAGLWALVSILALLEHTDLKELKRLAARLSFSPTG